MLGVKLINDPLGLGVPISTDKQWNVDLRVSMGYIAEMFNNYLVNWS